MVPFQCVPGIWLSDYRVLAQILVEPPSPFVCSVLKDRAWKPTLLLVPV